MQEQNKPYPCIPTPTDSSFPAALAYHHVVAARPLPKRNYYAPAWQALPAALAAAAEPLLPRCQPAQLWGVLWGLARLRHLPPDTWMAKYYKSSETQLGDFSAEGLAYMVWALGALGAQPPKPWLRSLAGIVNNKIRSFLAPQMTQILQVSCA